PPAASLQHGHFTRRCCCPTAKCSLQQVAHQVITRRGLSTVSRARNSTIRRAGPGRPPAASPPVALVSRRRCCPTARCSSQQVLTAAPLSQARNSTIRRAGPGRPPVALTPHAEVTRRRC